MAVSRVGRESLLDHDLHRIRHTWEAHLCCHTLRIFFDNKSLYMHLDGEGWWLMEFSKHGQCMRGEACLAQSSTGFGWGVGTQCTLSTPKSRATGGVGKSSHLTNGVQSRASSYERSSCGKKKQVVVRANPNGLKSNPRSASSSGDLGNQVAGLSCSKVEGSGFNFARAVQGAKVKPVKPPIQHPSTSSLSAGPGLSRSRTADRQPPAHGSSMEAADKGDPVKEKLFCQINCEHIEGARLLPTSILSSPSPGGLHTTNGGKTYGISESQRKAIADRISVSSSICIEETVNWCPGEWDYFNDLCMSLGLDPDYCIEDVELDTENGTAQFISDLLKAGSPKANRSVCMVGNQIHSGPGKDTTPTKITCPSNLVGKVKEVQYNNVVEEGTNDGSGNHVGEMGEDIQTTNYGDTMPSGALSLHACKIKEDIMKVVRNSWTVNLGMDQMDKDLILFYMGIDHSKENDAKFFKEYDTMIIGMAKNPGEKSKSGHLRTVILRRTFSHKRAVSCVGNNQRNNNAQRWRRHNDEHHIVSNGKNGTSGLVNLHERNIVINQNREEIPESLGAGRGEEEVGTNSGNKPDSPFPRLHDQKKMVSREGITEKGTNATTPKYRVVEMINRFSLLDTDGNELENVIEGMENTTNQLNKPSRSNEGWIKKQERILNTEYSKEINQEQRFEAKRYVIDQLIPLESVLSGWSNPQLQYFRQLCSIHNFGLGYLAANREGGDDMSDVDMGMDTENIEEVETETEGAAVMMKDDGPIGTNIVNQSTNEKNPCSPNQRDVDMLQAGTDGSKGLWLEVERNACYQEELAHRKNNKKRKTKGNNPFKNQTARGVKITESEMVEPEGKSQRTRHKICFAKNRRPEKNLSLKKIVFNQEINPRKVPFAPLGFSGFEMGTNHSKKTTVKDKLMETHMSKLDNLFEDLVARKDKLREIVANINTTNENASLINSILSMKSYRILKFSAKVNEEGKVIIDDKMIDTEESPEEINVPHPTPKQTSYANMLSGQGSSACEDKVQFEAIGPGKDSTILSRELGNQTWESSWKTGDLRPRGIGQTNSV
ncbi:hypothetical protein L1987_67232 [Smallanthus sonchifolius]|uniref:Uncharacterized protein n=1 Tax=Smallanthus sonchifolius TaxID=185202 RepID=A0ACB9BZL9_9ASTR|nr:hypothetical protein L1987_67232 [Smallanthus sonchifolius]